MLLKKLQKEGEHIVNEVQFDIRSSFEEKKVETRTYQAFSSGRLCSYQPTLTN